MGHPDILELFARQHGVASRRQLLLAGATSSSISRALDRGAVVSMLPGIYRLTGQAMTFRTRAMAAQLHCGPRSFLDGTSAGSLLGLRGMPVGRINVTASDRINVVIPSWIKASRTSWVIDGDIQTRAGFLIASPLRTLLALAATFNFRRFEQAAEDAWHLGLVTPDAADCYLAGIRRRGRHGIAAFERWLAGALPRDRPAQSGLEAVTLTAIRQVGLPEPVRQHPLVLSNGELIHLDLAWPDVKLAIEPGHSWWHGGNQRMHADYARDRACGELGWHIVRFDESMGDDPAGAGRQVKRIYDARRA